MIILASGSPQRKKLLGTLGLRFRAVPSRVRESFGGTDWRAMVRALALRKASAVARSHPRALVVGADTVVVCRGKLLLKPKDRRDSARMLGALNGRWHRVYTGLALVRTDPPLRRTGVEVSRVLARRLDPGGVERLAGKHMDKSGGYAVQDRKDPFIRRVSGPLDNVVGFPRSLFRRMLRSAALPVCLVGGAFAKAPALPVPLATRGNGAGGAAGRIEALRPVLERIGIEARGPTVGWPREPDLKEPKLSAVLDETEYLASLRPLRDPFPGRPGTENRLTDFERHRIGIGFFRKELEALGFKAAIGRSEGRVWVSLEGPGGRAQHGELDLYLRSLERAWAREEPLPSFRRLALSVESSTGAWSPAELEAFLGEHVSLELSNRRPPAAEPAAFRLEGVVDFREVRPLGGTIVSFLAPREGERTFAYFDPQHRERGEGRLRVLTLQGGGTWGEGGSPPP